MSTNDTNVSKIGLTPNKTLCINYCLLSGGAVRWCAFLCVLNGSQPQCVVYTQHTKQYTHLVCVAVDGIEKNRPLPACIRMDGKTGPDRGKRSIPLHTFVNIFLYYVYMICIYIIHSI